MLLRLIWIIGLAGFLTDTLLQAQEGTPRELALAAPGQSVRGTGWPAGPQPWIALVRGATGARLDSVNVRAIPGQDPCTGPDTTLALDRVVDGEVLLLLRGRGLTAGPVQTAWAQGRFLYPGENVPLPLGDQVFSLAAYGRALPGAHDTFVEQYHLVLSQDTIAAFKRFGLEGRPEVRWAGDLDRDGKPDLVADLTTHYVGNRIVLFLSRGAAPGHVVRVAGRLDLPGC